MKPSIFSAKNLFKALIVAGLVTGWQTSAAVYQESGGQVVVEAESFHARTTNANTRHWHLAPDEDGVDFLGDTADPFLNARGGKYMQMIPNTGLNNDVVSRVGIDPYLDYKVNIATAGTYQLYLRRNGTGLGGSDSMYGQIVELMDGIGGVHADWYRYAGVENGDFALTGWQGLGGRELVNGDAGGNPATWVINTPGLYTVRLSYREDGVGIDSFILQLSSRAAPDNTAPNFGPPQSAVSTSFPVFVRSRSPQSGATGVFPETSIRAELEDGGSTQINTNSIVLSLNGTPVAPTITKSGAVTSISYIPPALFSPGTNITVTLRYNDTAGTPQSFTNTWSFTVENYATLPASLARPAGSVDTTSSGFSVFVHQASATAVLANDTARAEAQLRGTLIDPATGTPYTNHVVTGTPPGNFIDGDVINWNQDSGLGTDSGNFQDDSVPPYPDEPIPGIPGDELSTDNIAAEMITYLELPAGLIRLGVNSDDGFRVTSAVNPRDASALQLGVFSGGRGASDTLFSVMVEAAGIYPVRLIWYEGGGLSSVEFFSVNIATGQKILINNRTNAGHIKAYLTSTFASPPMVNQVRPAPNAVNVNAGAKIFVELLDQATQVNSGSVVLSFNGSNVTASASVIKNGASTTISYDPPGLLPSGSTNNLILTYTDSAATSYTNAWRFVVQNYSTFPVIAPDRRVTGVNTNQSGFLIKFRQMEVARPGGNNLPAPLIQLNDGYINPATGQPYPDVIDRTQPGGEPGSMFNPDGSFTEVGIINYSEDAGAIERGAFQGPAYPDKPIPGVPGTTLSDNNIAMLAMTLLELKAGVYRFAVNSDDGFLFTADNPMDIFATRLGVFDGGRGAASTFFNFVVNEDGLYPFSLVWWEGGGDANVELFSVDPDTGANIPINYRANTRAIKAYRPASLTSPRPFVQSVNPTPGSTSVFKDSTVVATLVDGNAATDTNTVQLLFNGSPVNATITRTGTVTTVSYDPPGDMSFLSSNTVTLSFSDTGSPVQRRTNSWSFIVESSLPKALLVVGNPAALTGAEAAIRTRLQSSVFGFEVIVVDDDAALPVTANRAGLIVISSSVGSGNITKYRDVTAPILNWEWAAYDGLGLSTADGATIAGQTQIEIINSGHPLAAAFPTGVIALFSAPAAQMAVIDPILLGSNVVVVATAADGTGRAVLFAVERGVFLEPDPAAGTPVTAPARRTGIFLGGDTFTGLNPDGIKLFDAAVNWTAGISTVVQPRFNPPALVGGGVVLSWTGTGTLEQTDSLFPVNWTAAPSQANPQTVPPTGQMRFYRIRQ